MESEEKSVRELRESLADVLNAAAVDDKITIVTSRGRALAAIVPLHIARAALAPEPESD